MMNGKGEYTAVKTQTNIQNILISLRQGAGFILLDAAENAENADQTSRLMIGYWLGMVNILLGSDSILKHG